MEGLKARHAEPQRVYHIWAHIEALLAWYGQIKGQLKDPRAVELAILYHDAVYDPRASDNEAQSAALLRRELETLVPRTLLEKTESLILATAGHDLPETSDRDFLSDCAFFLDMDLSILGTPPAVFEAYEDAIRREYAFVPPDDYRQGRGRILGKFLARERLYFTDHFHDQLEDRARENLAWSLERLGGA